MRRTQSIGADYFENLYGATPDPWGFETSAYERQKYVATLAALGGRRYVRALEVGCSIGVLTSLLGPSCDDLLAVDISPTALAVAAKRCASLPQVRLATCAFPTDRPATDKVDLIVLSEVVYYWDSSDIAAAARLIRTLALPGGDLILVHWIGETDYPKTADQAVAELGAGLMGSVVELLTRQEPDYRLDLWRFT